MKKLFYIVLLVVVLTVVGHIVKNYHGKKTVTVEDTVTLGVDDEGKIVERDDVIVLPEDNSEPETTPDEVNG